MKKKRITKTALRILGLVIFALCIYDNDMGKVVWFVLGTAVVFWVIPGAITEIIFFKDLYDGTFLIDETDPTDVKFKLTFDTPPEVLAKSADMVIKIDHREGNIDVNGGVSNETEENKR